MTTVFRVFIRTAGKYPMEHTMGIYSQKYMAELRMSSVNRNVSALVEHGNEHEKTTFGYGMSVGIEELELDNVKSWPFEEKGAEFAKVEAISI